MDITNPNEIQDNPGDFDILALLSGVDYPEQEVVLYTDLVSATKLKDDKLTEADKAALRKKITDSAIHLTVKGSDPGAVMDVYESEGTDEEHINTLIAMAVRQVKTGTGVVDPRPWDAERVSQVRKYLAVSELAKLIDVVSEVNFNTSVFDDAVDAGFSS